MEEESLRELSIPRKSATRLCYFSVPLKGQPFYRERVFPIVRDVGLVPVTTDQLVSPGENKVAKIDTLISRSFLVVIDVSSEYALREARNILEQKGHSRLCIIVERGSYVPKDIDRARVFYRPSLTAINVRDFLSGLATWFRAEAAEHEPRLEDEVRRLLSSREYRAAVIVAITHLEIALRTRLAFAMSSEKRFLSIRMLLGKAAKQELLGKYEVKQVSKWIGVRNDVVHSQKSISRKTAREIVLGSEEIRQVLNQ